MFDAPPSPTDDYCAFQPTPNAISPDYPSFQPRPNDPDDADYCGYQSTPTPNTPPPDCIHQPIPSAMSSPDGGYQQQPIPYAISPYYPSFQPRPNDPDDYFGYQSTPTPNTPPPDCIHQPIPNAPSPNHACRPIPNASSSTHAFRPIPSAPPSRMITYGATTQYSSPMISRPHNPPVTGGYGPISSFPPRQNTVHLEVGEINDRGMRTAFCLLCVFMFIIAIFFLLSTKKPQPPRYN